MSVHDQTLPMGPAEAFHNHLNQVDRFARIGRVTGVQGTIIRAQVPEMGIGELCRVRRPVGDDLTAEVVGFDDRGVLLMPLGTLDAVAPNGQVLPIGTETTVPAGPAVTGRVLDALGHPIDNKGPLASTETAPLMSTPPNPLTRVNITKPLPTGIRAIDAMLTVGHGQRVGIFAAAGVGKSTLLGMLTRFVEADAVVMALIGERGREVQPFIENDLGASGLAKSTVVVSTSDQPALLRLKAAYTATAIAETLRRQGAHVVLLMDSVTRFARALRDVGLATGEAPGRAGYPPSVFAALPQLFERAGNDAHGSITAFYTVLVAGNDLEEPIADESLSLLDGHIILSRRLAQRGHFPAIDVPLSKSRVMNGIVSEQHRLASMRASEVLGLYEENYDKITCGAYEEGYEPVLDDAIRRYPGIVHFLRQGLDEPSGFDHSVGGLIELFANTPARSS